MANSIAPRGPYRLVTVNTVPERAQQLVARLVEALKDRYTVFHIANCETIDSVEQTVQQVQPDLLFCASMWSSEEAAEIQTIARRVKPDIATYALPQGLQVQQGPDAVVAHLTCMVPQVLQAYFGEAAGPGRK